jgi:hypothetical protein
MKIPGTTVGESCKKSMRIFHDCIVFLLSFILCFGSMFCLAWKHISQDQELTLKKTQIEENAKVVAYTESLELKFAQSPEWFRRCPGLYIPVPVSAGAVMLSFNGINTPLLPDLIDSFRDMPELLTEAKSLGTNTLYLIDFYEGLQSQTGESSIPSYLTKNSAFLYKNAWWNKGDYLPRSDLGGPEAFKEGIDAVHRAGGRIIVYVEGFIISDQSHIGQTHGEEWAILTDGGILGPEAEPYTGNWKMCPACPGWVEHMITVCRRLVGEYGVDGIHIDSFGAQRMGYRCMNPEHNHPIGETQVFHDGRVELTRQVRKALHEEKYEAVIMIELPTMLSLFEMVDGSQDWGFRAIRNRPLWDRAGQTDIFTAGWSLDDIHCILAIGHKLSLGRFWIQTLEGMSCNAAVKAQVLNYQKSKSKSHYQKLMILKEASMVLFHWYNTGLLLNRPMPDLESLEVSIRGWLPNRFQSEEKMEAILEKIAEKSSHVDVGLQDYIETKLPSVSDHIKDLLLTRIKLSHIIDDGSMVRELDTGFESVSAYYFVSTAGHVLTIVNASNESKKISLNLPDDHDCGKMIDEQNGSVVDVREEPLELSCPAHSLRMFRGSY